MVLVPLGNGRQLVLSTWVMNKNKVYVADPSAATKTPREILETKLQSAQQKAVTAHMQVGIAQREASAAKLASASAKVKCDAAEALALEATERMEKAESEAAEAKGARDEYADLVLFSETKQRQAEERAEAQITLSKASVSTALADLDHARAEATKNELATAARAERILAEEKSKVFEERVAKALAAEQLQQLREDHAATVQRLECQYSKELEQRQTSEEKAAESARRRTEAESRSTELEKEVQALRATADAAKALATKAKVRSQMLADEKERSLVLAREAEMAKDDAEREAASAARQRSSAQAKAELARSRALAHDAAMKQAESKAHRSQLDAQRALEAKVAAEISAQEALEEADAMRVASSLQLSLIMSNVDSQVTDARQRALEEGDDKIASLSVAHAAAKAEKAEVVKRIRVNLKAHGAHVIFSTMCLATTRRLALAFRTFSENACAAGDIASKHREATKAHGTQLLFRVVSHALHKRVARAWRTLAGEAMVARALNQAREHYEEQLREEAQLAREDAQAIAAREIDAAQAAAEAAVMRAEEARLQAETQANQLRDQIKMWLGGVVPGAEAADVTN